MEYTIQDVKWPKTLFDDTEERKEGLHLSDIIKSLQSKSGLSPKGSFSDLELTAEIGLLWEDVLSKVMGDKYALRPPQICRDGIWMSPDGIGLDPEGEWPLVVEEYKATWRSTKQLPVDNFYYMAQVKSYCLALDTRVAVMHNFHLMGDYKGSGPIYRVARIVFHPYELEQNWEMITRHAREMEGGK